LALPREDRGGRKERAMMGYQDRIAEHLRSAHLIYTDYGAVEALMRIDPVSGNTRTLDGMSAAVFRSEALACAAECMSDPALAREIAESMAL